MIDQQILDKLLAHKDDDVKALAQEYQTIVASPTYDTYITVLGQTRDWNSQLKIGLDGKGKIDLFADKDEKAFERAFKYFHEILSLNDTLDKLRAKLSPEDKKRADKETAEQSGSTYEIALKKTGEKN